MHRPIALISAVAILVVMAMDTVACSSDDASTQPAVTEASETANYCADLVDLLVLLDDGGTVEEYNALLAKIVDESPAGHAAAWSLMLTLSEEPFTYENFNPAVDAIERVKLDDTCAGLERLVVDDYGRVRHY